MRLPGRLRTTTLGDLLGALYRAEVSGVLELVETTAGRSHRVHVDGGLVEKIETPFRLARLGEVLKDQGLVGADALGWLERRLKGTPSGRTGELLVEAGLVTAERVGAAVREQLKGRLDALFEIGDALIRFHVPRPRQKDDRQPPLGPREFLHGRPRWRDRARAGRAAARAYASQTSSGASEQPTPRPSPVAVRLDPTRRRALTTLGLLPSADRSAVQRAFRRLASELHPDRHPKATAPERAELIRRFAELSAAYHALVA
jgi:hypothetical protein